MKTQVPFKKATFKEFQKHNRKSLTKHENIVLLCENLKKKFEVVNSKHNSMSSELLNFFFSIELKYIL